MPNTVVPVVHLGGTPSDRLIEDRVELSNALRGVLRALEEIEPNGRDFPFADDSRFAAAREQYSRRQKAIQCLLDEVLEELEGILAQVDERDRQRR